MLFALTVSNFLIAGLLRESEYCSIRYLDNVFEDQESKFIYTLNISFWIGKLVNIDLLAISYSTVRLRIFDSSEIFCHRNDNRLLCGSIDRDK